MVLFRVAAKDYSQILEKMLKSGLWVNVEYHAGKTAWIWSLMSVDDVGLTAYEKK